MDVLVVDDIASSALTFSALISRGTGLVTSSTDDPVEALRLVATEAIAVVVLDERMPDLSGTELFARIREIDGRTQAIMLTAEADQAEVGRALNLGFSAFLEKKQVQDLPKLVMERFIDFQAQLALDMEQKNAASRSRFAVRGRFLPTLRRHRTFVAVSHLTVLDEHCAPDGLWQTVERIEAGETITTVLAVSHDQTVVVETERVHTHGAHASLPTLQLVTPAVKQEIERRVSREITRRRATERRVERTLTLPVETQDRDTPQIRSRSRQEALSCTKVRVILEVNCTCCEQRGFTSLVAYVPDGGVLSRQVDTYSDGLKRVVDTADFM